MKKQIKNGEVKPKLQKKFPDLTRSMIFSYLRSLKEDVKIRLHNISLHNMVFYQPGKKLELDSKL